MEAAHQAAKATLADEERRCNAVAMGMVADESGEDKTLADQLKDTQNDISTAETELQQIKMRIDHAKKVRRMLLQGGHSLQSTAVAAA